MYMYIHACQYLLYTPCKGGCTLVIVLIAYRLYLYLAPTQDIYGRSAADYASLSVQDEELVSYLVSKGAKLTTPKPKRSASGKCDIAVLTKTKADA